MSKSLPPRTPGRPKVLNDQMLDRVLTMVRVGCSVRQAARIVGVGEATIRSEVKRNPLFARQMDESRGAALVDCLRTVQKAMSRSWRAAAWIAEHLFPEDFNPRQRIADRAKEDADVDEDGNLLGHPDRA